MFRRLQDAAGASVRITVDGRPIEARAGDSVAAALLAAGFTQWGTRPVSGAARAPYCMTGACFDCRVTIDGVADRRGCLVRVADGMAVQMPPGVREPGR